MEAFSQNTRRLLTNLSKNWPKWPPIETWKTKWIEHASNKVRPSKRVDSLNRTFVCPVVVVVVVRENLKIVQVLVREGCRMVICHWSVRIDTQKRTTWATATFAHNAWPDPKQAGATSVRLSIKILRGNLSPRGRLHQSTPHGSSCEGRFPFKKGLLFKLNSTCPFHQDVSFQ